ncbi:MAG: FtsX-like permease family protein [Candidatus Krumholzibacteria bacterium]|jgi:lipoprotein-releasing system permease protein|nr:FtsX-like permease family protein [Candidatus Krumholzibacteria bacterium]MDP6668851.1 FtsX-like permease family protein [Candidatus Krumholzibacteria bacterium]MDP6796416.1 FtsX-like permease family protein [Candidatus Krumholzibacteria bacterium]MDP7020805.1 FtsX-like permease family protein [Candidatus Krumholzibacteria bacterium]
MRYPGWILLRHIGSIRRRSFLGRVSLLAILGVMLGVATLVTVLSFMQGFQSELRRLLTEMNPSIFVSTGTAGGLAEPEMLAGSLADVEGLLASSPYIQQRGVLSKPALHGLKLSGVILRGLEPSSEALVTSTLSSCDPPFEEFLQAGGSPGILLSSRLARELASLPGEKVTFTTVIEGREDPLHLSFLVQGLVETGLYEFDRRFAYADLSILREVLREGEGVDGLGIRVADPLRAREQSIVIRELLPFGEYQVADWMDLNGEIFRWMKTMRSILLFSLGLIILVAGFNISGTMTLVVSEKTREIGILRSLGAKRRDILQIYILEGWILGLLGVGAGLLLSLVLRALFRGRALSIPGEIYFIDNMPMELEPRTLLLISLVAILISLASALFPGLEALRRSPLDALQGEGRIRA